MSNDQHVTPDTKGLRIVDNYDKKNRTPQQVREDRVDISKRSVATGIIIVMVVVFVIIFTGGFDRSVLRELNTVTDEDLTSMSASQVSEELAKAQDLVERGNVNKNEVMPHVERLYDALEDKTEASLHEWKKEK